MPIVPHFQSRQVPEADGSRKGILHGKIQDLIALVRCQRTPLTAATSIDDYEWALRQISAAQDDAFCDRFRRNSTSGAALVEDSPPGKVWDHNAEMREVAMADNVLWGEQCECRRGRVFSFRPQ